MEQEIWKDIAGYEGLYQVSNLGRVKSVDRIVHHKNDGPRLYRSKILKPLATVYGYLQVVLSKNGVVRRYSVHRLVATTFIPNDNLFSTTVNHKNEVKADNRVENLEWMSQGDNTRYSQREGGTGYQKGRKSPNAKQVRCIETGQVFGCATEASKWAGLNKYAVGVAICKGCSAGGYHWEHI